jgi:hypothetical protein
LTAGGLRQLRQRSAPGRASKLTHEQQQVLKRHLKRVVGRDYDQAVRLPPDFPLTLATASRRRKEFRQVLPFGILPVVEEVCVKMAFHHAYLAF